MTRSNIAKLGRKASGSLTTAVRRAVTTTSRAARFVPAVPTPVARRQSIPTRLFSTTPSAAKPAPVTKPTAANITDAQYHELANEYLETILVKYEEMQDVQDDFDVEFSSGVMTVKIPNVGTYVINKQPPNKQIWLSSPVSGPKRYDYVILSDGQVEKQDTDKGEWVYLRDGSTLSELLRKETGLEL